MSKTSTATSHSPGSVSASHTSVAAEYRALTEGVGLIDRSAVGRLRCGGEDALDLINRLSTNELMGLEAGSGASTILTSNKGRIVDLLHVFMSDDGLTVLTSPEARRKVADWIDFYTIMEDVTVRDVTAETAMLSLAGPGSASLLGGLAGQDTSLEPHGSARLAVSGVEAVVYRTDFVRSGAYDLVVDADRAETLREALLEAGPAPVGAEALEAVRIEQGTPSYGNELAEDFNPLEAGLREHISFSKGCYVGQEVVARLDTYKKVQKRLVGLAWDSETVPGTGAKLLADGKQVGVVTSAARSPRTGRGVGLGYVRNAHAAPGTVLGTEGGADAVVTGPPGREDGS